MNLVNLDTAGVRQSMLAELEQDIANNNVYTSPRLSAMGRAQYLELLRDALVGGAPNSLAIDFGRPGMLNSHETRNSKKGPIQVRVPTTAPETLAEGEFNRYYARGICRHALDNGQETVEVYRAKEVADPRPESQAKIGTCVSAKKLLDDLRTHQGIDTALGIPAGPNSGLSVRLT